MPYSFHSHSGQFCGHGYGQLEDVVKEAIRKGFHTYGLSEHMPRFTESELYPEEIEANWTPKTLEETYSQFQNESKRLQQLYKNDIHLLIGSEIEFINPSYAQHVQALRDRYKMDYVVGSLHHTGSIPIDFSPELYAQALEAASGDLQQLYLRYFEEQYLMLQTVRPEVVGHFDLIRIFADPLLADKTLLTPEVWKLIRRNVEYVIGYDGLFEVNSRAWKKGLKDAYPQRDIIQLILEKGGKLTLSDDCHGPNDVGMFYDKLQAYLAEMGIQSVCYLAKEDGKTVIKEHKDIVNDEFWKKIKNW